MRIWRRQTEETAMELYARVDTKVYAHIVFHHCECVTAWDVKADEYVNLKECASHG